MKRSDVITVVIVAALSAFVTFLVTSVIIGNVSDFQETVKTADPVSSDVTQPDPMIFNKDAINPTVEVFVGQGNGGR